MKNIEFDFEKTWDKEQWVFATPAIFFNKNIWMNHSEYLFGIIFLFFTIGIKFTVKFKEK